MNKKILNVIVIIIGTILPLIYAINNNFNIIEYILNSVIVILIIFIALKVVKEIKCKKQKDKLFIRLLVLATLTTSFILVYYCLLSKIEPYRFSNPEMFKTEEEFISFMSGNTQYSDPFLGDDGLEYVTVLTGDKKGEKVELKEISFEELNVKTVYIDTREDLIEVTLKIIDEELTYKVYIQSDIEEGKGVLSNALRCIRAVIYFQIIIYFSIYYFQKKSIKNVNKIKRPH